jgi:hypothetical protein
MPLGFEDATAAWMQWMHWRVPGGSAWMIAPHPSWRGPTAQGSGGRGIGLSNR